MSYYGFYTRKLFKNELFNKYSLQEKSKCNEFKEHNDKDIFSTSRTIHSINLSHQPDTISDTILITWIFSQQKTYLSTQLSRVKVSSVLRPHCTNTTKSMKNWRSIQHWRAYRMIKVSPWEQRQHGQRGTLFRLRISCSLSRCWNLARRACKLTKPAAFRESTKLSCVT